jgi:hypothetical protein
MNARFKVVRNEDGGEVMMRVGVVTGSVWDRLRELGQVRRSVVYWADLLIEANRKDTGGPSYREGLQRELDKARQRFQAVSLEVAVLVNEGGLL